MEKLNGGHCHRFAGGSVSSRSRFNSGCFRNSAISSGCRGFGALSGGCSRNHAFSGGRCSSRAFSGRRRSSGRALSGRCFSGGCLSRRCFSGGRSCTIRRFSGLASGEDSDGSNKENAAKKVDIHNDSFSERGGLESRSVARIG